MFITHSSFIFPGVVDVESLERLLFLDAAPFVRWHEGFAGRIGSELLFSGLDLEMIEGMKKLDRSAQITSRLLAQLKLAGVRQGYTIIGSARGASGQWETFHESFLRRGKVSARTSPLTTAGGIATSSMQVGEIGGASLTASMTCSSSLHAIIQAARVLKCGEYSEVVAGGVEAPLTSFTYAQFDALRLLAKKEEAFPSKPLLKKRRNQLILSEGGGLFAMSASKASKFKIAGWGEAREGEVSMTSFPADSLRSAMRKALMMAGVDRPDLIVAHAPGTIQGDQGELAVVVNEFGPAVPVLSTKALTGHTLGASGAISLVFAMHIMEHGLSDGNAFGIQKIKPRNVLINATGFGGNAASIFVTFNP